MLAWRGTLCSQVQIRRGTTLTTRYRNHVRANKLITQGVPFPDCGTIYRVRPRTTASAASAEDRPDVNFHFQTHEDLVTALHQLKGDPLESEGGRIVVYRGNPKAKLVIIGEGPGAEEDLQGEPFVGRSGQLLDKIVASVQLDRDRDVYVTNIVKRRPLNNRDPTIAEMEYYRPWLEEELRLVDPDVVMLAGRHAMKCLLGETQGITKVRGTWYEQGGRWWMPVFHPSYLLRNPQWKPGSPKAHMWGDINSVKRKLDELSGAHPAA
mmetsp:Transcript_6545/g.13279  ORF Transcript_6545/g.13279 Transcript_6545/m.13279 type:complete len:266 (+) Transcript_6545:97-894(+)